MSNTIVVSRPAVPAAGATASPVKQGPKAKGSGALVIASHEITTYGCEHLRELLQKVPAQAKAGYMSALKVVYESRNVNPPKCGACRSSVIRTRFCLQCPSVNCAMDGDTHRRVNGHVLGVDSRGGCLYCYACGDYVYDPTFEQIRRSTEGLSGLSASKKRKLDDLQAFTNDDMKFLDQNSTTFLCRSTPLRGLHNMGSTCFISVIVQCLVHNPLIRNYFLADGHKAADCNRDPCMSCALDEIFTEFFSTDTTAGFAATNLLRASWEAGKTIAGKEQHDAGEYMLFFLQALCESNGGDSTRGECKCIIHQCFYGVFQTDRQCKSCLSETAPKIDVDLGIQLPLLVPKAETKDRVVSQLRDSITLQDCIDGYTHPEIMKLACESCGKKDQDFISQSTFKKLPIILCLTLKRFQQMNDKKYKKNETRVRFPMILDMTPYTSQAKRKDGDAPAQRSNRQFVYDLLSVVVHHGEMDTGHYTSFSRYHDPQTQTSQWYKFDDSTVTKATERQVLTANPYILFYVVRSLC